MQFSRVVHFARQFIKQPTYSTNLALRKFRLHQRLKSVEQKRYTDDNVPAPLIYELTLTLKCNLRCKMCTYWGRNGQCYKFSAQNRFDELAYDTIESLIIQTKRDCPSFILHGGEPLLHSRFGDILKKLKKEHVSSIICTNGILLDRHTDLLNDNPYADLLVSLDGLEEENDELRGKGVYKKTTENIKRLKALQKPPHIGIQFTIMPENVDCIYDFCKEMVGLGVDWILLNPCWFLTKNEKEGYERFMEKEYGITPQQHLGYVGAYDLDVQKFLKQYKMIRNEKWPIQISCYLQNPEIDMRDYVLSDGVFTGNKFCYKQWIRMDVTAEGKVTPCIRYPDLIFGDLRETGPLEIWNSPMFAHFRSIVRCNPMHVCKKCNCIYLYDQKRMTL
jgi:MoaA/NifB/PqqE/SkfB family radical SAM enzyme